MLFQRHEDGPDAGKFVSLDFGNLLDVSSFDDVLRETFRLMAKDVESATGALVGAMALKHPEVSEMARSGEAELGYWIGVPYWGRGYATEAAHAAVAYGFDELGLSAIWAGYYEGNERSHRVQEKLGFEFRYRRECDVELLGERRVECCQLLVPERVR